MEEKYYVAKSYQNWERCGNPFYSNNKLYTRIKTRCDRCSGSGTYIIPPSFAGTCFQCHGQGMMYKEVRLYTEKEFQSLERAAAREKEKKAAEQEARDQEAIAQSDINKKKWFAKNGFNENGITWIVTGGNTFDIKDMLKENGCKFHPILKWHCAETFALPDGYKFLEIAFDEVYEWYPLTKNATIKDDAELLIQQKVNASLRAEIAAADMPKYIGIIGERSVFIVTYEGSRGFDSYYGYTYLHFFKSGNDTMVWRTTKELNLEKGAAIALKGTIVEQSEYQGLPQTRINRCTYEIIKE